MRLKLLIILIPLLCAACNKDCSSNKMPGASTLRKQYTIDENIEKFKQKIDGYEKNPSIPHAKASLRELNIQLGTLYLEKGSWDSAIEAFNNSVKHGNVSAVVFYSLGLAYANRGKETSSKDDITKAEYYYAKSLENNRRFYRAAYALSILLFYQKNEKARAITIMEEVAGKYQKFYMGRFVLARYYYEAGRRRDSLRAYEDLYADLKKLPDSSITRQYKTDCNNNINRLIAEMGKK